MILLSFLLPIISCSIIWFFSKKKIEWIHIIIVFLLSILGTIATCFIISSIKSTDFRYVSSRIVKVRHYESWNELVTKTRTVTVRVGDRNVMKTETYTTVETFPERFVAITESKNEHSISSKKFNYYKDLWKTEGVFVDMHRNYHTKDGDAFDYLYSGIPNQTGVVTEMYLYKNPIKRNPNLFRIPELVGKKMRANLFKYPNGNDDLVIQGLDSLPDSIINLSKFVNSMDRKFRCHLLVFKSPISVDIVEKQKHYWQGGKDNEVVFCVGLNKDNTVEWFNSFSWSSVPKMESSLRYRILPGTTFDIQEFYNLVIKEYKRGNWIPRDFSQYSYISVSYSKIDSLVIFLITLLINIITLIIITINKQI